MTHDELLSALERGSTRKTIKVILALRAVVELHKQRGDLCKTCLHRYPCTTIKAIENELK